MFVLDVKQYACPFFAKCVFTATAHCTWLPKMVVYGLNPFVWNACRLLFGSFWQLFTNVFANMPIIKSMTDIGALFPHIFFFICTCLSVAICFILISLASIPCKTFWKPYFSILFEFPHSANCVTGIAAILSILCSKKYMLNILHYALGYRISLHHWRVFSDCEIFETTSFSSLTQASLATPNK